MNKTFKFAMLLFIVGFVVGSSNLIARPSGHKKAIKKHQAEQYNAHQEACLISKNIKFPILTFM